MNAVRRRSSHCSLRTRQRPPGRTLVRPAGVFEECRRWPRCTPEARFFEHSHDTDVRVTMRPSLPRTKATPALGVMVGADVRAIGQSTLPRKAGWRGRRSDSGREKHRRNHFGNGRDASLSAASCPPRPLTGEPRPSPGWVDGGGSSDHRGEGAASNSRTAVAMKAASTGLAAGLPARCPQIDGIGRSSASRRCCRSSRLSSTWK